MLFKTYKRIEFYNIIDCLWLVEVLWIAQTWMFNDYPNKSYLIFRSFTQEIAYMMTYWIARNSSTTYLQKIIINARKPLTIGILVGLYCFFFNPRWYVDAVERTLEVNLAKGAEIKTGSSILEQLRFRSFYNGAYPIAYLCCMSLIYEFFPLLNHKRGSRINRSYINLYIIIMVLAIILCMMRAPIMCCITGFIIAFVYSLKFYDAYDSLKPLSVLIGLIILISLILLPKMDSDMLNFIMAKFVIVSNNSSEFIKERFWLQAHSFSFCGEGFGRFNRVAEYMFNMPSIPDGEYMKMVAEQGFVGVSIILSILVLCLYKAAKYFKYLYFEFCVVVMLAICMIGADPLSIYDKHCFLFWLALGQISKFSSINKYNYMEKGFAKISIAYMFLNERKK